MSDELDWKQRQPGEQNYRARNAAATGTYVAYHFPHHESFEAELLHDVRSNGNTLIYSRPAVYGSLAAAMDAAQEHHRAACRAERWRIYMETHEPPEDS